MLHIIQSNRMEALQLHLSQLLLHDPLTNLFQNEIVLVQSPGMAQWLKVLLAKQHGVSAQTDFVLPSSYIWRLYQALLPDTPKESSFNKPNIAWKLLDLLPKCLEKPEFSSLAQYLAKDGSQPKLFALCEKIADVYDQYLMYRPQWLKQWENGEDALMDVDVSLAPWQPILWRALNQYTQSLAQPMHHRANLHETLLATLADESTVLTEQRVIIFGISALANQQLEIIHALAQKIDVYLYLNNPSCHYWGDLVDEKTRAKIEAKYRVKPLLEASDGDYFYVGNPLLSSWGKLGRDYLEQLVGLDAQWHDVFIENFSDTLLGQIQREVFELAFKGDSLNPDPSWFISHEGKIPVKHDDSMIIADCHSPLREVEVLHDHLLAMFEKDKTLTPKDIVVMMPDVGLYSPYIEAVFGSAQGNKYIPYAISDLAIEQEKPILTSFKQLAAISESRFSVSQILDLLQVEPIAKQFDIGLDEIEQISFWLEQVKIRWAIDGEHKTSLGQPNIELNTWRRGLDRLLLGTMNQNEDALYHDIYPADEVEGMAVMLLGNLIQFFDCLCEYRDKLNTEQTIEDKVTLHHELINVFYHPEDQQSWDLNVIKTMLDDLLKHYSNGDYKGLISQQLMLNLIDQGLSNKGVGQRFLAGQVNVCTLMPMRAVPFKVVCILGLNDADYPRSVQPMGFDLLHHSKPQKGDRSRKFDDRYLFLEALLSVREQLYLSYVGHSSQDNSERLPSNLVSELCEYINRSFTLVGEVGEHTDLIKQITVCHYLQPFNPRYYQTGKHHSYNHTWLPANIETPTAYEPLAIDVNREVELSQMLYTLVNPQQAFYQSTIGVRLPEFEYYNQDDEPFELDALTQYQYLSEFLQAKLGQKTLNHQQLAARGALPQAKVGTVKLHDIADRIDELARVLSGHHVADADHDVKVAISVGKYDIEGYLNAVIEHKQCFYRPASVKPKDLIKGYVSHLVGILSEQISATLIFGLDSYVELKPMSKEAAYAELEKWLTLYEHAKSQPVAFFPVSAMTYTQTQSMAKAQAKFESSFIAKGEGENPYIQLDFKSLYDVEEAFIGWCERVLKPMLALMEEHKYA